MSKVEKKNYSLLKRRVKLGFGCVKVEKWTKSYPGIGSTTFRAQKVEKFET